MVRLILVRHGQSRANRTRLFDCSVPGPGLSRAGRQQSIALADSLESRSIDEVWASTMLRAQQTALPLAAQRGVQVQVHGGLREVHKGDLHLRSDREAHDLSSRLAAGWLNGDLTLRRPGGESGLEAVLRFQDALARIAGPPHDPGRTLVLVTHGGVLRLALAFALTASDHPVSRGAEIVNAGLVEVEFSNRDLGPLRVD